MSTILTVLGRSSIVHLHDVGGVFSMRDRAATHQIRYRPTNIKIRAGGREKIKKNRHEKHEFGPVNWATRRARRGM
jgi:hypothetical protein